MVKAVARRSSNELTAAFSSGTIELICAVTFEWTPCTHLIHARHAVIDKLLANPVHLRHLRCRREHTRQMSHEARRHVVCIQCFPVIRGTLFHF